MLQKYTIYTLVDITETKNTDYKTKHTKEYNQQQNLNTLIQLISLRSQPVNYSVNKLLTQDIAEYDFGIAFTGQHTVWKMDFVSEHSDIFNYNDDPVYFLKEDCDGAAFTDKLNETVKFKHSTFECKSDNMLNTYFLKLP